jgi:archaellum component FlaC
MEFPELKEMIVARVRALWDEGYVIPEIEFIVNGEIRILAPEIQAERAKRMELIRDARVRRTIAPMDRGEAYLFRLLDEVDAIKAETEGIRRQIGQIREQTGQIREQTGQIREQTGQIRAETEGIGRQTGQIRAETEGIRRQTDGIRAETDTMAIRREQVRRETDRINAETERIQVETEERRNSPAGSADVLAGDVDGDVDAKLAALRARSGALRARRAEVSAEAAAMLAGCGGDVVPDPLRPPPADSDHCVPAAVGGTEKKSPARTGRSEPQRGVRWWPFAKK